MVWRDCENIAGCGEKAEQLIAGQSLAVVSICEVEHAGWQAVIFQQTVKRQLLVIILVFHGTQEFQLPFTCGNLFHRGLYECHKVSDVMPFFINFMQILILRGTVDKVHDAFRIVAYMRVPLVIVSRVERAVHCFHVSLFGSQEVRVRIR